MQITTPAHSVLSRINLRHPLSIRGYDRLWSQLIETEERSKNSGPFLAWKIARRLSAPIAAQYNSTSTDDLRTAIVLSLYHLSGEAFPKRPVPFELSSTNTSRYFHKPAIDPSVILLSVGQDEFPKVRGLDAAERKFDKLMLLLGLIINSSKDSQLKHNLWANLKNLTENPSLIVDGLNLQFLNDSNLVEGFVKAVKRNMESRRDVKSEITSLFNLFYFCTYSDIPPFISLKEKFFSSDTYEEVLSENKFSDFQSYRLKVLDYLINSVLKKHREPVLLRHLRALRYALEEAFNYDTLTVEHGNHVDDLFDSISSCIGGIHGTRREAYVCYEADPNIAIIGLYPNTNGYKERQIVKAITVRGIDIDSGEEKLVLDGVIANDELRDLLGLDWRPIVFLGLLQYARNQGIKKLIINCNNGLSHESVPSFKYYVATQILGLKEGDDFSYALDRETKHHDFRLNLKHVRKSLNGFSYTHMFKKPPMPDSIVEAIGGRNYKGESFLEAWQDWYAHLTESSDTEHRIEELRPVWNIGCGPITGIEIDVEEALAKIYSPVAA